MASGAPRAALSKCPKWPPSTYISSLSSISALSCDCALGLLGLVVPSNPVFTTGGVRDDHRVPLSVMSRAMSASPHAFAALSPQREIHLIFDDVCRPHMGRCNSH